MASHDGTYGWGTMVPPQLLRDAVDFEQYVYGTIGAMELASRLGHTSVSLIELGVAGGNGLVELERLGSIVGLEYGVAPNVVGFDLGSGMPAPIDYRDSPYAWQEGFFRMDEELLRGRLSSAELLLGDVRESGRDFIERDPPPIGFISFDLDYYSSTLAAIETLLEDGSFQRYLPRVLCYFDDTVGPHAEMHSPFSGELLAISEFNDRHTARKIAPIHGLRHKVGRCDGPWVEGMFVLHIFDHPNYCDYVFPEVDRQFPLGESS